MSGAPIRRRDVLAALGGAAAWPRLARAQQRGMRTIGVLYEGSLAAGPRGEVVDAFFTGLAEMGYVEGRNVTIALREAGSDLTRLPELARDLVRRQVDVIVAPGSVRAALAAKAATTTIPIVFSNAANPIKAGLVASLSRPGGNTTGISDFGHDLSAKRLELFKLLVPNAAAIALLVAAATGPDAARDVANVPTPARSLGIDIVVISVSIDEMDAAFATLAQKRVDGVCLIPSNLFFTHREQVVGLAARHRLPAVYPFIQFAEIGGLMSYGSSLTERNYQMGIYAGLILNGKNPADLPVYRIARFELAINVTTAKALGVTVPARFLALADKVIE